MLGLTTLAVGAGWRTAAWFAGLGLAASGVAWLLNLPWSPTWSWADLAAPPLAGATGRGALDVATMAIGRGGLEVLSLALYLPVVVALAVARAWRLSWAARAGGLIVVFLGLAVLQDRDALPFAVPDVGVLLVPVALGLALSAASAVAAFGEDVAGRTFGWRQPAGLLSIGAVAVGVFPALLTVTDGSWFAPRGSLVDAVEASLRPNTDVGDYRVLYIGDPRLIPFPSEDLGGGVSIALVDDGETDLRDRWAVTDQAADDQLSAVVDEIAATRTLRGGRLLAPFGVRYVVVPLVDGATSTAARPLPLPSGLLDSLGGQLDLVRTISPPDFARFENSAVIPTTASLQGALAEASSTDDVDALVAVDTAGAVPTLIGADATRRAAADLAAAGVVSFATPLDDAWRLTLNGAEIAGRPAFGVTTAYDAATTGPIALDYVQPSGRSIGLVVQGVLWVLVLGAASRIAVPSRLRGRRTRDETLIVLDTAPGVALPERTGFGGWVDERDDDDDDDVRPTGEDGAP